MFLILLVRSFIGDRRRRAVCVYGVYISCKPVFTSWPFNRIQVLGSRSYVWACSSLIFRVETRQEGSGGSVIIIRHRAEVSGEKCLCKCDILVYSCRSFFWNTVALNVFSQLEEATDHTGVTPHTPSLNVFQIINHTVHVYKYDHLHDYGFLMLEFSYAM